MAVEPTNNCRVEGLAVVVKDPRRLAGALVFDNRHRLAAEMWRDPERQQWEARPVEGED